MRYHRRVSDGYPYTIGFPVGVKRQGKYYGNNHFLINLQYHVGPDEFEGFRVVCFEVYPQSLVQKTKQGQAGQVAACDGEVYEQNFFDLDQYPSISSQKGACQQYTMSSRSACHFKCSFCL